MSKRIGKAVLIALFGAVVMPAQQSAWMPAGNMAIARRDHTATLLGTGRVLVMTGTDAVGATAELFDPATNGFTFTGPPLLPHGQGATATRLQDGRVLIVGGRLAPQKAEIYDPSTRIFRATGDSLAPHSFHTTTLLADGKVLIAGGQVEMPTPQAEAVAELFDPAAGTFSRTGDLTTARSVHTATLLNDGRVLIAGGTGAGIPLSSAELYSPSGGSFTMTAFPMTRARSGQAAVLLQSGRVFLVGDLAADAAEVFDPVSGRFFATDKLITPRGAATATLLSDGTVLVAGGMAANGPVVTATAEIYEPNRGIFTSSASMGSRRQEHTATLLQDGRVIAIGGFDGTDDLASAETFLKGTGFCPAASISRSHVGVAATGDVIPVDLNVNPGCPWTLSSSESWVTTTPPSGGSGPTRVVLKIDPNALPTARTATVTIAGRSVTVTQASAGCLATPGTTSITVAPQGGTFAVDVGAAAPCVWFAAAAPFWISIQGASSGAGNTPVVINVAPNPDGVPRTGSLQVSGMVVQVVQQRSGPATAVFSDVPIDHPYFDYIDLLQQRAITQGCTTTTYCPDSATTRGQMAVFIIRALEGGDAFSYPTTPYFTDVPALHPYFRYIQRMRELGITSGCNTTLYCPDDPVTRGQMAVFLVRARAGLSAADAPPPGLAQPFFSDAPTTHPYFAFIQKLREWAITVGCSATTYCGDSPTTRGQMAVFIIRTFFTP